MDIRNASLDFSLPLSGSGPRSASMTVVFPRAVNTAVAGLTGYAAEYSGGNDHHVGLLEIKLDTTINDNTVTVDGRLGLRDWSGNWDDEYDGSIDFVVVADLVPVGAPPPRGDLSVNGMELNQAVQFFLSASFLDPGNVRPDNSIFLIARKNTGVRVYVDWDSSAGLPPIANLTGQLTVETSGGTVVLSPINPGQTITPKPATQINQALANDTLNFLLPAAQSVGTVTVSCQVWDQAAPDSKSASFTRTLVFVPVAPLNIFLVGVNLTNIPAAAPTQAQVSAALAAFLVKTYPRGDIVQTGFTTINFGETVTGPSSSGCTSGFNDLLENLEDLGGDSGNMVFGALPTPPGGIPAGVIGCNESLGDGVGTAFIAFPSAMAHELGHALGRDHTDTDSNYPRYDSFPTSSIGVFGFDPTTNTVFNPASAQDFMNSSVPGTPWVSPYTYQALLGGPLGAPGPGGPQLNPHGKVMTLFLGLSIDRKRKVTRRPSFHYRAPLQWRGGCKTDFLVEFLDADRRLLDCAPLHCRCTDSGCRCWPKVVRDALPLPPGARWLLVWEDDDQLYEEEIPDPPGVEIIGTALQKEGLLLKWDSDAKNPWYLVHWFDRKHEVFRGVAPRLQDTSLLIPRALFADGPQLEVCVLATSGIATGRACGEFRLDDYQPQVPSIGLVGVDPAQAGPKPIPCVITAAVTDAAGRQPASGSITWYREGAAFARGRQLDLRSLSMGRHVVRAVLRGFGGRLVARSWLIERTPAGCLLLSTMCDPPPKGIPDDHPHPHPEPPPCDN
jgi:hypothetical protein